MKCDNCGNDNTYDGDNTIYLKCMYCDNILIKRMMDNDDDNDNTLFVTDYGYENDRKWVKVVDSNGNEMVYYR